MPVRRRALNKFELGLLICRLLLDVLQSFTATGHDGKELGPFFDDKAKLVGIIPREGMLARHRILKSQPLTPLLSFSSRLCPDMKDPRLLVLLAF